MREIKVQTKNSVFQMLEVVKGNRTKRHRLGLFFVESVAAIKAMVAKGLPAKAVVLSASRSLSDWAKGAIVALKPEEVYRLDHELMEELSDRDEASEIIVLARQFDEGIGQLALEGSSLILLLDRPSNPGNLGSILRSGDAFGVDAVVITGHAADLYDPAVVRSSLGAIFYRKTAVEPSIENVLRWIDAKRKEYPGLQVLGTDSKGTLELGKLTPIRPVILCIGNEATGLSQRLKAAVDAVVAIPMRGSVDSLNVACAASIVLERLANG